MYAGRRAWIRVQNMTPTTNPTARRLNVALLLGAALLAVAAPAQAQLALPAIDQSVATPIGALDAHADQDGASTCLDMASPAVPAVPYVPLPVATPAVPQVYAQGYTCADAGLDGINVATSTDAAGLQAEAGSHLDTSQQHDDAKGILGSVKGFFEDLGNSIVSLF